MTLLQIPIVSVETICIDLPARYFRKGTDMLALIAVDEPTTESDAVHSVLTYDALELDRDPAGEFSENAITAEAVPTVYYVRRGNELSELVDIYVRHISPEEHGQVVLAVGAKEYHQALSDREFGKERVEFSVPEFAAPVIGAVTVVINGRSQLFQVTLAPAKKWNILMVPNIHLDIGFSDYQGKVAEVQSRVLDEAVQLIREHPDFRFSADGFWSARQYMAGRSGGTSETAFPDDQGQEDLHSDGGSMSPHRLPEPRDPDPVAQSRLPVSPAVWRRRRLCQHNARALLFRVLCVGAGRRTFFPKRRSQARLRTPMQLHALDIAIIVGYFVAVITIGLWVSRKGTKRDLDSYFLGGKKLPWYMLGVSDASGMFDISGTMLLVYWLFLYGVKSIWLPWVWPTFNQIFLMMFMSKWLRRSNVLTGGSSGYRHALKTIAARHWRNQLRSVVAFALIERDRPALPTRSRASASSPPGSCRGTSPGATTGVLTDDNIYAMILYAGLHGALRHQGGHGQRGHYRGHAVHRPDPDVADNRGHRIGQGLAGHDREQHSHRVDEPVLRMEAEHELERYS